MSERDLSITEITQPDGVNDNEFLIKYSNGNVQKITIVDGQYQYSYATTPNGTFTEGVCDAAKLINPKTIKETTTLTYNYTDVEGKSWVYTLQPNGTIEKKYMGNYNVYEGFECTDIYGNTYTQGYYYAKDKINDNLYRRTPEGKFSAAEDSFHEAFSGDKGTGINWSSNDADGTIKTTWTTTDGEEYELVVKLPESETESALRDHNFNSVAEYIAEHPDTIVYMKRTDEIGTTTIQDGVYEYTENNGFHERFYDESKYDSQSDYAHYKNDFISEYTIASNIYEGQGTIRSYSLNNDTGNVEIMWEKDGVIYTITADLTNGQKEYLEGDSQVGGLYKLSEWMDEGSLKPTQIQITESYRQTRTYSYDESKGGFVYKEKNVNENHVTTSEIEIVYGPNNEIKTYQETALKKDETRGHQSTLITYIEYGDHGSYTKTETQRYIGKTEYEIKTEVDGSGNYTKTTTTYDEYGASTTVTEKYNATTGSTITETHYYDPEGTEIDKPYVAPPKEDSEQTPEPSGDSGDPAVDEMAGMMKWNTSKLGSVILDSDKLSGAKTQISNASTNLNGIDLSKNYGSIDISFVSTAKTSLETITGEHTTNTDEVTNEKDALTTCESDNLGLASIPTPPVITVSIPQKDSETTKPQETGPTIYPTVPPNDHQTETTDTELEETQTDELQEKIDALKKYNIDTDKLTDEQVKELYDALKVLEENPAVTELDKDKSEKLIRDLLNDQLEGKVDINKISKDDLLLLIANPSNLNEFFLMHKDEFDFIGINKITLQTIFTLKDLDDKTAHDYSELQMYCVDKYKLTAEVADDLIEKFLNESDLEDYETTVFILVSNFMNDPKGFEEKFGFPLYEAETQKLNTALLFVDLFMFLETQEKNSAEFSYITDELYGDERFNVENLNRYLESKGIKDYEFVSNSLLGKTYLKNAETLLEGEEIKPTFRFRYLSRLFTENDIESLKSGIAKSLDKGKAVIVNVDDSPEMLDEKMLTLKSLNPNYQDTDLEHPGHLEVIGVNDEGIIVMHESREYVLTYDQIKDHDITIDEIELKEKETVADTQEVATDGETTTEETTEEGGESSGTPQPTPQGTTEEGNSEETVEGTSEGETTQPSDEVEDPSPNTEQGEQAVPPTPEPEPQPEQDIGDPPGPVESDIGEPPVAPEEGVVEDGTVPSDVGETGEPPLPSDEGNAGYDTSTEGNIETPQPNNTNQRPRSFTIAYRGPLPEEPGVDIPIGEGKIYNPPSYDLPVEPKPTPEDM